MGFVKHESSGDGKNVFISKGKLIAYPGGKRAEHEGLQGNVLAIDFEMDSYQGKEYEKLLLFIQDKDGDDFVLQFPLTSGYGSAFCKIAKNVDWTRPVEISAKIDGTPPKQYGGLFIKQPNDAGKWVNVKWAYTEGNPGKMPPAEKGTDRNGEFNDYTKRNAFFRDLIVKLVGKAIRKAHPDFDLVKAKAAAKASKDAAALSEPIDDLPF